VILPREVLNLEPGLEMESDCAWTWEAATVKHKNSKITCLMFAGLVWFDNPGVDTMAKDTYFLKPMKIKSPEQFGAQFKRTGTYMQYPFTGSSFFIGIDFGGKVLCNLETLFEVPCFTG
jgi:hypothetical protein